MEWEHCAGVIPNRLEVLILGETIMSIKFFTRAESGMQITVPPELIPEFIQMVERATNTWQDKSKDMYDFRNKLVAIKKELIASSKI